MIKITIEIHPYGDESKKRTIGVMDIWNDNTGTKTRGNYVFKIFKQGSNAIWGVGEIKDFPRERKNVWYLLHLCLSKIIEKERSDGSGSL